MTADDTLTDSQRTALDVLRDGPADKYAIADACDVTPPHARDGVIAGLREAGFEIEYDRADRVYRLEGAPADGFEYVGAEEPPVEPDAGADDEPDTKDDDDDEDPFEYDAAADDPDEAPDAVVRALKRKGLTYEDFQRRFDCSQERARSLMQELRESGFRIEFDEVDDAGTRMFYIPDEHDKHYAWREPGGHYRFAILSDTHLGSTATHLQYLEDFYDRLVDAGIEFAFHAGDITDGWEVHKGQINEVEGEAAGWSRMLDYAAEHYPQRDGLNTYFIEGNHDHKYHRRNGIHLGRLLADRREDLHFLGDSMARIVLDPVHDIDLELIHPSGGKPYTEGYRVQTLYRERPFHDRPTFAAIGHLHGSLFTRTEGVTAFYAGCWKDLTAYGKRKGHKAEIGGWIVDVQLEAGTVRSVTPRWINYTADKKTTNFSMDEIAAMAGE